MIESEQMKTVMLLCDYAETINGKLYIMGGGWTVCPPGPRNMAIALKIIVPWTLTNIKHRLSLILQDEFGNTVSQGEPPSEVRQDGEFEVGRPPGVPAGSDLDFVISFIFMGIVLEPDRRYRWQLELDGEPVDYVSFRTAIPGK